MGNRVRHHVRAMTVAGIIVISFGLGFITPYLIHWLDFENGKRRKRSRARDFFGGDE